LETWINILTTNIEKTNLAPTYGEDR
jgi:hypothetical protein